MKEDIVAKDLIGKSKKVRVRSKVARKGPRKGSKMPRYDEELKAKVVKAIRKGMTHREASLYFQVGLHSIPNWVKHY